jgi:lipopolysaccharide heptosyltransferase I
MTKKILLVKTSSLGDLIHNLPVVNDIRAAVPEAHIDWVVEESFLFILRLHPGLAAAIPVAIRRWRRTLWRRETRDEIAAFLVRLRAQTYDAVIDSQGLMKSALIASAARGTRCGLDWRSAREPLGVFYDRTFRVPWTQHAVERNRLLAAQALGYAVPDRLDYGISATPRGFDWLGTGNYAVLLHATSGDSKLWDEHNWITLGEYLNLQGIGCVLPWGNAAEHRRAERIARAFSAAAVPPVLSLDDLAALFAGARAVVGVDTGLTHLAAVLGKPTVGIYVATNPAATGIYGCPRAANLGGIHHAPSAAEVIAELQKLAL